MKNIFKLLPLVILIAFIAALSGCAQMGEAADAINPFAEPGPDLGERSNNALLDEGSGGGKSAENARHALKVVGQYRSAQLPEPAYPVIRPAEVRLMWIPDHLSKTGDLVPAHYYYLKVLHDRWEVQDAFDNEKQLNQGSSGVGTATPWIYK